MPVAAMMVIALALTGCAAGQIAQTADEVAAIDGANGTVGHLGIRNALVATATGAEFAKGADAPLALWISNDGVSAQTLTSVTTPAATSVLIGGAANLPPQTLSDFTGTAVTITLKGLTGPVVFGKSIPVTFGFSNGENLTIKVPLEVPTMRSTDRPSIDIQPTNGATVWGSGIAQPTAASG